MHGNIPWKIKTKLNIYTILYYENKSLLTNKVNKVSILICHSVKGDPIVADELTSYRVFIEGGGEVGVEGVCKASKIT